MRRPFEDMGDWLTLSIGSSEASSSSARPERPRGRRPGVRPPKEGRTETIEPPYPWATSRRVKIHKLSDLIERGIIVIKGDVECKQCKEVYTIEYDLVQKFSEVGGFLATYKDAMQQRAPDWMMNPQGLDCKLCGCKNCVIPQIKKKRSTNWLFLLLGRMIGHCKLTHLKYYLKHADIHRTGAKDRLVFLTYLDLCKQLDPDSPYFDLELS